MIHRVPDVLQLEESAQVGKGPQRLQIAGPRRQILSDLDVGRCIETAEQSQVRSFGAEVGNLEQHAARELLLDAGGPLLHIRSPRVLVDAEVAGEPG